MDIRRVTDDFAVSPQIEPGDVPEIARLGFRTVICNRPDDEEPGQPDAHAIGKVSKEAGIAFHFIPITGGHFPSDARDAFLAARKASDGPVLAYCRTGTRSITLEMLANPDGRSVAERINLARRAGYDLGALAEHLEG